MYVVLSGFLFMTTIFLIYNANKKILNMFKEKTIKIKLTSKNFKKYREKYGKILKNGDEIFIDVEDLPKWGKFRIDVICDCCGVEKSTTLDNLNRNPKEFGLYYCPKCKGYPTKKTYQDKYGVDNVFQLQEMKNKSKETCLEKYGVEYPLQNKDILEKQKSTNLERYGYEYQMQNPKNKEKSKETCLKKYGVTHNMQDQNIFDKQRISGLKIKKYKNTDIYYQGTYEKDFLDKYLYLGISRGNTIKYTHNNKEYIYYPDFFNIDKNIIIEIKSTYWYEYHKEKNELKRKKCIEQGYNFFFLIDKDYTEFEKFLNCVD